MASVFRCGLEEGDFSHFTSLHDTSPTIVTSRVHGGQYAMRCNSTSPSSSSARRDLASAVTSGTYFTRFYWAMASLPASVDGRAFMTRSSAGTWNVLILVSPSGVMAVWLSVRINSAITLTVDTLYRIELRHLVANTGGQAEVRIYDGDSLSALDTFGDGNFPGGDGTDTDTLAGDLQRWYFGANGAAANIDYYYDDLAINDATGSVDNSWVGPGIEEVDTSPIVISAPYQAP